MKIVTWNVNGIRACYSKGLIDLVRNIKPDVLCLQETKARESQLSKEFLDSFGMEPNFSEAQRSGYSGVATFFRPGLEVKEVRKGIGRSEFDSEGRFVIANLKNFTLFNIYFPNGGSGPARHQFKQEFLSVLLEHLRVCVEDGMSIVLVGDYNIAHSEMDVYDAAGLCEVSGFRPEERSWFDEFLGVGFVDAYRRLNPNKIQFTWWDYRMNSRWANRGWRIDYICLTQNLMDKVVAVEILEDQMGSDHCPILIELNL